MRDYTITYDDNKTVTVKGRDAENARANLKKAMPNVKIKSTKIKTKIKKS